MKLLTRILLVLLVNKLNVLGQPTLQNLNLTSENEAHSKEVKTLKFEAVTSAKETLLELDLENDRNNDFQEEKQFVQNLNLTSADVLQLDLRNKPELTYRSPEMAAVNGLSDSLEMSLTGKFSKEVFSNPYPMEQEDHKNVEALAEERISISDTFGQITTQYEDIIANQDLSRELGGSFLDVENHNLVSIQTQGLAEAQNETKLELGVTTPKSLLNHATAIQHIDEFDSLLPETTLEAKKIPILAESQNHHLHKYEISSLGSTLHQDVPATEDQNTKENIGKGHLNNFTQSWPESRKKSLTHYHLDTKPLDSKGLNQSSSLIENVSIEIVLKETTNLTKKDEENSSSSAWTASSNSEVTPLSSTESVLAEKALEERTNLSVNHNENASNLSETSKAISDSELLPITPKHFGGFHNDSGAGYANLSKGQDGTAKISKEEAETSSLLGTANMNDAQKEVTLGFIQNSNKMDSSLIDNEAVAARLSNSLLQETLNERENEVTKEVSNLNQTQEKYFIATKSYEKMNLSTAVVNELSQSTLGSFKRQQPKEDMNKREENSVLKEMSSLLKNQKAYNNAESLENFAETRQQSFLNSFKGYQNSPAMENNLKETILPNPAHLNETKNDNNFNLKKDFSNTETTILTTKPLRNNVKDEVADSSKKEIPANKDLNANPLNSIEKQENYNKSEKELVEGTEAVTVSTSNAELSSIRLEEPNNYALLHKNFLKQELPENSKYPKEESSSLSLEEEEEQEPQEEILSKPVISLEEYAVTQMNFILDHLLLETQKFVANVLQATINSVYPRDRLKHYAEGVTELLNPLMESDYSEAAPDSFKTANQDELYELIVEKLNFLKTKPSKYLQKQIPPEWLNQFLAKKAELAIWLDKAALEMHKEFTAYITPEEDPIKYQYFNETFDDISRATEIHHKLAFLADLVKIIKNKKQITFMDLYMQT